jgi:hypothetical protein
LIEKEREEYPLDTTGGRGPGCGPPKILGNKKVLRLLFQSLNTLVVGPEKIHNIYIYGEF